MRKQLLNQLKKAKPTPEEYERAKRIIQEYEQSKNILFDKKFYVDRGLKYYTTGMFNGFEGDKIIIKVGTNHWITTDSEHIFETKQRNMKINTENNQKL